MKTKNGQAFIANFLKKGQNLTIKVGDKTHVYSVKKDGEFANDVLAIGSSNDLGMTGGRQIVGRTLSNKPDGIEIDQDGMGEVIIHTTLGKSLLIWLITNRKVDESISNLSHEAFVHAVPDMNRLRELRKELNDGTIKPGTKAYEMKLEATTQSADADHKKSCQWTGKCI